MKITLKAQTKILLHTAKYPSSTVIGLLTGSTTVTDCFPLLHTALPLASTLDAAFAILLPSLLKTNSDILAVYFSNESTEDQSTPLVVEKLVEKTGAVALRVDFSEKGVSLVICGKSGGVMEQDPGFSMKVFKEKYTAKKGGALDLLHDFDSHLDDVSLPWLATKKLDLLCKE